MDIADIVKKYKANEKKVIARTASGNVVPSLKGLPVAKQASNKVSISKDIKDAEALAAEVRRKGWVK